MLTAALPGQRMLGRETRHGMIRICICPGEGKRLFYAGCPRQPLGGACVSRRQTYPWTGMVRMVWMLANMVLKCSGFFLKPISVRTSDWLMSGNGWKSAAGRKPSGGLLWLWRHLLAHTQTAHLPVRTLGWARRCRRPPCLCALCTFCPPRSCKRSRTRSEMEETRA